MDFTLADRQAILELLEQHKDEDLTDYSLTDINGKDMFELGLAIEAPEDMYK